MVTKPHDHDVVGDGSSAMTSDSLSWEQLLEAQADGIVLVDPRGLIGYANERIVALTGRAREDLVGRSVETLIPNRFASSHPTLRERFAERPSSREMGAGSELRLVRHDGTELAVDVALSPITVNDEPWTAAFIRDDSERRLAETMRLQSELRFRMAFEDNVAPMIFTDLDNRAFAVNNAFCDMTGYGRDEILGRTSRAITHPDDLEIAEQFHRRCADGEAPSRYIKRYLHKDGRVIIVEVLKSPARDTVGNSLYYVISECDITERVQRNNLLRLHVEVNRIATHAATEDELRQQLCDAMVDVGGYTLAWIGVTSRHEPGGVDVMCASGATDYLQGEMAHWWGSEESGHGPTANALRTGQSQVANDLIHHDDMQRWGSRARHFGFGSMIAVPDRIGDRRAALVIYHPDAFAFDEITKAGLENVVREAELALVRIRATRRIEESLETITLAHDNLRESQRALSASEQRFRLAFEHNMAPMIFSDHDDIAIAVNDAFCEMIDFTREELLGQDSQHFTLPEDVGITEATHARLVSDEIDQARYVKRYRRRDGSVVISEVSKTAARDATGETVYFLSSERDITEERALTDQLSHQALHDPLTGLANRLLFEDRLGQAHARVLRDGGVGSLMLLDLDDFKGVNDTHGHLVGDQLLVAIARRFEQVTRSSDSLCRFGGDEFLFLIEGLTDAREAEEMTGRLLEALAEPFTFGALHLQQHASVGVVVWGASDDDGSELLRHADIALHEAKDLHKGGYSVFAPSMVEQAISRFTLAQELRQALDAGGLAMHYQPIVDLDSMAVVGFESLMRWHHPERGMVPPDVFIALAEQSHLIVELGAFAMREALLAASGWVSENPTVSAPYVTVNLSAHQFYDPGLIAMIEESLAASGLSPTRLILEITESAALVNIGETLEVIDYLRRIGVGFALDDFGTGFSSLSYLTLLQPRIIKIDRSFVSPAQKSPQNDTLLESIIALGTKLNITLLAEGIETSAQLDQLCKLECAFGQGFLFSPAVPAEQAAALASHVFSGESGNRSEA